MTSRYIKNDDGLFIKGVNGKKLRYIFNKLFFVRNLKEIFFLYFFLNLDYEPRILTTHRY